MPQDVRLVFRLVIEFLLSNNTCDMDCFRLCVKMIMCSEEANNAWFDYFGTVAPSSESRRLLARDREERRRRLASQTPAPVEPMRLMLNLVMQWLLERDRCDMDEFQLVMRIGVCSHLCEKAKDDCITALP